MSYDPFFNLQKPGFDTGKMENGLKRGKLVD